jgi:hypothetical protein
MDKHNIFVAEAVEPFQLLLIYRKNRNIGAFEWPGFSVNLFNGVEQVVDDVAQMCKLLGISGGFEQRIYLF